MDPLRADSLVGLRGSVLQQPAGPADSGSHPLPLLALQGEGAHVALEVAAARAENLGMARPLRAAAIVIALAGTIATDAAAASDEAVSSPPAVSAWLPWWDQARAYESFLAMSISTTSSHPSGTR